MTRLRHIADALRSGFVWANTPAVPTDVRYDIGLSWLNEATLVGISIPPPRSAR